MGQRCGKALVANDGAILQNLRGPSFDVVTESGKG